MTKTALAAVLAVLSTPADAGRYDEVTTMRIGNRVISVGDSPQQLRQNASVSCGNYYTFCDSKWYARCALDYRGYCSHITVWPRTKRRR
jgi:hypothetical protein